MPDNVLGDVFEGLKDTAASAASQASPLKIVETGVQQVTGQQNMGGVDEKAQKQVSRQIKQMKAIDDKNKKPELEAIRQNLIAMMQPKQKPSSDLPKNVSGVTGGPATFEDLEKQQEKIKKERKKLPDLSERLKLKNQGSNESFRGVSG